MTREEAEELVFDLLYASARFDAGRGRAELFHQKREAVVAALAATDKRDDVTTGKSE